MKSIRYFITCLLCLISSIAFAEEQIINPPDGTITLKGVKDYVIPRDLVRNMNDYRNYRGPAIRILASSTPNVKTAIRIVIPKGVTLKLTGSHASDGNPAYPAIELPENTSLLLTGEGTVILQGGNGIQATNGGSGKEGDYDAREWYRGGDGGMGGTGGYGSAPAIGTCGGKGGKGGVTVPCPSMDKMHKMEGEENRGGSGTAGDNSANMGNLYITGTLTVTCNVGSYTSFSMNNAAPGGGRFDDHDVYDSRGVGGGGGGGQGGAACKPKYGIGAGAPGAGGGGAGGSGGIDRQWKDDDVDFFFGYGGEGGKSYNSNGGDGKRGARYRYHGAGGAGGYGGARGSYGSNGYVWYTARTIFSSNIGESVDPSRSANIGKTPIDKAFATYMHRPDPQDPSKEKEHYFCNGLSFEDLGLAKIDLPKPNKANAHFKGYIDQYGNQVYDEMGNLDIQKNSQGGQFCYKQDKLGGWIFNSPYDIRLTPLWSDSVYVVVSHAIENPEYVADEPTDKYTDHAADFVEIVGYEIPQGSTQTITLRKFYNINGEIIPELLSAEELDMSSSQRRYRIAQGEKETTSVTIGDKPMVHIVQKYDRNSFYLKWDYSDAMTDKEFDSHLENKDDFTANGSYKYGKRLVRPQLRSLKGKAITDWTPAEIYSMPASDCTLTAVTSGVNYTISQNVDIADTDCSLTVSKVTGISYDEMVTLSAHLVGDTRLNALKVYTSYDNTEVALTQMDDTTYTFRMPDDNIRLDASFAYAHYGLITSVSNRSATKVAIQGKDNLFYTDDNDYFLFPDSLYGGKLNDFAIYQNLTVNIIADINHDVISDEAEGEARSVVQMHCGNKEVDEPVDVGTDIINGRVRKTYSFRIDNAKETYVKVLWANHLRKQIRFICPFDAEISAIASDIYTDIRDREMNGATACVGDYVYFTVKTSDKDFNKDNVVISYLDANNIQRFVPVKRCDFDHGSPVDSLTYAFIMPNRNVDITLYTGEKIALTNNFNEMYLYGENDSKARKSPKMYLNSESDPQENYSDGYQIRIPQAAVKGSVVPFFISADIHDLSPLMHPILVYDTNTGAVGADDFAFQEYSDYKDTGLIGTGSFPIPDDEYLENLTLDNGYLAEITELSFTYVTEDEELHFPDFVKKYTVTVNDGLSFDLHPIDNDVPSHTPVLCMIDLEMFMDAIYSETLNFVVTCNHYNEDNFLDSANDLKYATSTMTCGELHNELMAETGKDYLIYVFDIDDNGVSTFRHADDSEIIERMDAYLPILNTGNTDPIYPTGIHNVATGKHPVYDNTIYDMNGRILASPGQLRNLLKGKPVIINGKKIICR